MNPMAYLITGLLFGCGASVSKSTKSSNKSPHIQESTRLLSHADMDDEEAMLDEGDSDHLFIPDPIRADRSKIRCTKSSKSDLETVQWGHLLAFDTSGCAVVDVGLDAKGIPVLVKNKRDLLRLTNCEQVRPQPEILVDFKTQQVLVIEGLHSKMASEPLDAWLMYKQKTLRIGLVFDWQSSEETRLYRAIVIAPRRTTRIETDLCYAPTIESN